MIELELSEVVGVGGVLVEPMLLVRQEDEDGLLQLDGDLVFELCVGSPRGVWGAVEGFGSVHKPGDMDHRIAPGDLVEQHRTDGAVIGREVGLLVGVVTECAKLGRDLRPGGAEVAGGRADEYRGEVGHGRTPEGMAALPHSIIPVP